MKKLFSAFCFIGFFCLPAMAQDTSGVAGAPASDTTVTGHPAIPVVPAPPADPRVAIDKTLLPSLKKLEGVLKTVMKDKNAICYDDLEVYCGKLAAMSANSQPELVRALIVIDSTARKEKALGTCLDANWLALKMDAPLRQSLKAPPDTALLNAILSVRKVAAGFAGKVAHSGPDTGRLATTHTVVTPGPSEKPVDTTKRSAVHADTASRKIIVDNHGEHGISWETVAFVAAMLLFFSLATLYGVRSMLRRNKMENLSTMNNTTQPYTTEPKPTVQPEPVGQPKPTVQPEPARTLALQKTLSPEPVVSPVETTRYLLSEVLMTAGPRKDLTKPETDTSLGEDVCGLVTNTTESVAWVLDGTSDSDIRRNPENKREYFSCRLLAQAFASQLKSSFASIKAGGIDQTVRAASAAVKKDWQDTLQALPESEKQALHKDIAAGTGPFCSTAILIMRLSLDGQLSAYRCGDSKMLVYRGKDKTLEYVTNVLEEKSQTDNTRLYFKIIENGDGELDIWYSDPKSEQINEQDVRILIGFSDGVGDPSIALLKQRYAQTPDLVREEILYQLQGTGDDKSLCILEIVGG